MSLTLEEVEHIAGLARLELTDEEKARYREQLSAILDHVAKLQQLDTSDVPPTSGVSPAPLAPPARAGVQRAQRGASVAGNSHLRPDRPRAALSRKSLLKNAPDTQDNQFKIPPVFE